MPSKRKGFCNVFLEECLLCFKMYGDGKKYIYFVRYGVCIMYRIICRYFIEHESCICMLCETWSLKIYEKYVWVFCEECVYKIYGSVR